MTTITINPAPRADGSVIESQVFNYNGQFTNYDIQITGLGTGPGSDYENPANQLTFGIWYESPPNSGNYVIGPSITFTGGPFIEKKGGVIITDPPPEVSGGVAVPPGNIKAIATITGNFTAGLTAVFT